MQDLISRKAVLDALEMWDWQDLYLPIHFQRLIEELPPAQPERDTPIKPNEATDRTWGIKTRQAVCPKCDHYLGHVSFIGDGKGKRITYCETCGQAIDWEGWDFDE